MEMLLNRWRGTGVIFTSFPFIKGVHIYALYLGLLFVVITQWYIGIFVTIGFFIGESFGWGKWVGSLCYPENINLEREYQDKEGYRFPFIHYIANFIIKEKESYFAYCNLALYFRGAIWALCLYLPLIIFDYISYIEYIFVSIIWGIGFPLACWLSRKKSFNYTSKFISIVGKWESQEIYYGFIHFICNTYIILKVVYGI